MSDSIVFYIDINSKGALLKLISCCSKFIERLYFFKDPIFIRGAITKGELFVDNRIIFGEGLIKAYLLENNNAKYPRIILSKDLFDDGKKNDLMYSYKPFDDLYSVPLVYSDDDGWLCIENWFISIHLNDTYSLIKSDRFEKVYKYVELNINSEINNDIKEKYIYLIKHYDKISNNDFYMYEKAIE